MLSYRSGSKSLQAKIPKEDFEKINNKLRSEEISLMNEFFELDLNFIENPMYVLKNEISEISEKNSSKHKVFKINQSKSIHKKA